MKKIVKKNYAPGPGYYIDPSSPVKSETSPSIADHARPGSTGNLASPSRMDLFGGLDFYFGAFGNRQERFYDGGYFRPQEGPGPQEYAGGGIVTEAERKFREIYIDTNKNEQPVFKSSTVRFPEKEEDVPVVKSVRGTLCL